MIYLKRLALFALISAVMLSFTACKGNNGFVFQKKGTYQVVEEYTEISFTATIGDIQSTATFTAPSAVSGLVAIKDQEQGYKLKYGDMGISVGNFAVKAADDFFAAIDTLEMAGEFRDGVITASIDDIKVKGIIKNGCLSILHFTDGINSRKYIITTEATVWKTVQKQE